MRNRKVQRELKRRGEQKLDMRDSCGVLDPTPYYAVQNMIEERKALIRQIKAEIAQREKAAS